MSTCSTDPTTAVAMKSESLPKVEKRGRGRPLGQHPAHALRKAPGEPAINVTEKSICFFLTQLVSQEELEKEIKEMKASEANKQQKREEKTAIRVAKREKKVQFSQHKHRSVSQQAHVVPEAVLEPVAEPMDWNDFPEEYQEPDGRYFYEVPRGEHQIETLFHGDVYNLDHHLVHYQEQNDYEQYDGNYHEVQYNTQEEEQEDYEEVCRPEVQLEEQPETEPAYKNPQGPLTPDMVNRPF